MSDAGTQVYVQSVQSCNQTCGSNDSTAAAFFVKSLLIMTVHVWVLPFHWPCAHACLICLYICLAVYSHHIFWNWSIPLFCEKLMKIPFFLLGIIITPATLAEVLLTPFCWKGSYTQQFFCIIIFVVDL